MKISACTDALYPGVACQDAIRRAAAAGAKYVEFWGWWNKDLDEIERALSETGVTLAAMCTRFISMVDPEKEEEYVKGVRETAEACKRLGCKVIISQTGDEMAKLPRVLQHAQLLKTLRAAARALRGTEIALCIEPLNARVNHPGHYLVTSDEAAALVREADDPHARFLFDIYHQQITEGDLASRLRAYLPQIGHIHCAGVPGRGRLDNCEINYPYLFSQLDEMGYQGFAALELRTDEPDAEIARWIKEE